MVKDADAFAKRADFAYNFYFKPAEKDDYSPAVQTPEKQRSLHGQG
jgi:hypothetical protein